MNFDDLIRYRNVDGKVYLCDITRWLGCSIEKAYEIQDKLTELADAETRHKPVAEAHTEMYPASIQAA